MMPRVGAGDTAGWRTDGTKAAWRAGTLNANAFPKSLAGRWPGSVALRDQLRWMKCRIDVKSSNVWSITPFFAKALTISAGVRNPYPAGGATGSKHAHSRASV